MLQHEPHLFADHRAAVAALAAYVNAWSSYLNFEVVAQMGEGVAFTGYHVRALHRTGALVAYIAPADAA